MNTSTASPRLRASFDAWLKQDGRSAGPFWLQCLWTGATSLVAAVVMTLLAFAMTGPSAAAPWRQATAWARNFGASVEISLSIGIAVQLCFAIGRRVLGAPRFAALGYRERCVFFAVTTLLGLLIGLPVGLALIGVGLGHAVAWPSAREVAQSLVVGLVVWALLRAYFSAKHRQVLTERRLAQAQLERLQAQIEPHFLFNTLANVLGLIDVDLPRAKRMLESFTDYLRISFSDLRKAERTLGDELDLVDAYLCVVGIRMEDRLRVEVAVPDTLRAWRLPPLCLQPLVENAVIHGLEPSIDGGRIAISADLQGGRLRIRIADDGAGLGATATGAPRGHGTAIANIRDRLRQVYGEFATLELTPSTPRGACATLTLPATPPLAS